MSVSTENPQASEVQLSIGDVIVGYDESGIEIELRAVALVLVNDPNGAPDDLLEYLVMHDELNDAYAAADRTGWLVEDESLVSSLVESVLSPAITEA